MTPNLNYNIITPKAKPAKNRVSGYLDSGYLDYRELDITWI
jgi:hypothetical protein